MDSSNDAESIPMYTRSYIYGSPVSLLQEACAKLKLDPPLYSEKKCSGPPHCPQFMISVTAAGSNALGIGTTKKMAKAAAACNLVKILSDKLFRIESSSSEVKDNSDIPNALTGPTRYGVVDEIEEIDDNEKVSEDSLFHYCLRNKLASPSYSLTVNRHGKFFAKVEINGVSFTGQGDSIPEARGNSASNAMKALQCETS